MKLFYQLYGSGKPLIVLHGLLGTLDNWHTVSTRLGTTRAVYAIDARNHGRSPHADAFNYDLMTEDLREFAEEHNLGPTAVMGHSMGGKTAMFFALRYPERVEKLIIVDIAPRQTPPGHDSILSALNRLDLSLYSKRSEVDAALAPYLPDPSVRLFLLKNLSRGDGGSFAWKMNLRAITEHYDEVNVGVMYKGKFEGPALFVRGGQSDYIRASDEPMIRQLFPNARIETIERAGHWVHADAPDEFTALVESFLAA